MLRVAGVDDDRGGARGSRGWVRVPAVALRPLTRFNTVFDVVALALLVALTVVMVTVVGAAVYFRYIAGDSLVWAEEVARHLMVWLVFLGIVPAYRREGHIRLLVLHRLLPDVPRKAAQVSTDLIVLVIAAAFAVFGWEAVATSMERGQTTTAIRHPIWWVQLALPVGMAGIVLLAVEKVGSAVLGLGEKAAPAHGQGGVGV